MLRLFDRESKRVELFRCRQSLHFGFIIAGMPRHKKAFDGLSMTDAEILDAALIGLEHQRSEIEAKMAELRQHLDGSAVRPKHSSDSVDSAPTAKKRTMSAAARRRIAAAQRKRWAAIKKTEAPKAALGPKKRRISAAGRKRIIEATKKRWAEYNAKKAAGRSKAATTG